MFTKMLAALYVRDRLRDRRSRKQVRRAVRRPARPVRPLGRQVASYVVFGVALLFVVSAIVGG